MWRKVSVGVDWPQPTAWRQVSRGGAEVAKFRMPMRNQGALRAVEGAGTFPGVTDTAPGPASQLRFACTRCGACCDRSPEVELSEANELADIFVFRLMFRLYDLPRTYAGWLACGKAADSSEGFYESKRLLNAFAARKSPVRKVHAGKAVDYTRYLTISALTLDAGAGACGALRDGGCSIYDRRPLACRTVPFHYSRPEAFAARELGEFVSKPGYRCDTGPDAPVAIDGGRIVHAGWRNARDEAVAGADRDSGWRDAIVGALKASPRNPSLPSLAEIEANAAFGATTTSMRVAWEIAAACGLMAADECRALIAAQAGAINRALGVRCTEATRETLSEMRAEYRQLLNG